MQDIFFVNGGKDIKIFTPLLRGATGATGADGQRGITGATGATGATGSAGENGHSTEMAIGKVVSVDANEDTRILDRVQGDLHYFDFYLPRGEKGDKGEQGIRGEKGEKGEKGDKGERGEKGDPAPNLIKAAYITSWNDDWKGFNFYGYELLPDARVPLMIKNFDAYNLINLDASSALTFNSPGTYLITFTANPFVLIDENFANYRDFASLAFRKVGSGQVYAAANCWNVDQMASTTTAQGIFQVDDTGAQYEIANVSKKTVYLQAADLNFSTTAEHLASTLVSVIIIKLD